MRLVERDGPITGFGDDDASFYSIDPLDAEGGKKALQALQTRDFERNALADLLDAYNRDLGNDAAALENISRFREPSSVCAFSGQQLGLFGGPAYTVLKGISCLILARQHGAVPVFWMATEDHDVDEIDHTYLIDNLGNLNKFHFSLPKDHRFVEDLSLSEDHLEEVERFCEVIDRQELYQLIKGETSYSRAMARIMVSLFKGTGLVFVEPKILRPLAKEFLKKEIASCSEIAAVLKTTTNRLLEAGTNPALDVSDGTNLFIKIDGSVRSKIHFEGGHFKVGSRSFSKQELLELIETEPERFSTNAAARCVLQNLLFPVIVYAAGPGELAYYRQLKDYHEYHGISMPWIVPRLSLTVVTPIAQEMLEKIGFEPWADLPENWSEISPDIDVGGEELAVEWMESAIKQFGEDLPHASMQRFITFQSKKLQRKAALARLRKKRIAPHSLHYLKNLLHPHEKPQERVINWWEFQTHVDYSIIDKLLQQLNTVPYGHLYCFL